MVGYTLEWLISFDRMVSGRFVPSLREKKNFNIISPFCNVIYLFFHIQSNTRHNNNSRVAELFIENPSLLILSQASTFSCHPTYVAGGFQAKP
jgi:hypothetical protein